MSEEGMGLYALVLAAGASSRFGSVKQRARIGDQPLLYAMVSRVTEAVDQVMVVLGAHAADLAPMLKRSAASVLINRQWSEGLASSIRTGVSRLPPSCLGVMVVLADQARLGADDFRRLSAAWRRQPESLAAARYGAVSGAPAIFPRCLFSELMQLRGDVGARAIIERHASRLTPVPMPNAAFDLDTPQDLAALGSAPTVLEDPPAR